MTRLQIDPLFSIVGTLKLGDELIVSEESLHALLEIKQSKSLKCELCNKFFDNVRRRQEHQFQNLVRFCCSCGRAFRLLETASRHINKKCDVSTIHSLKRLLHYLVRTISTISGLLFQSYFSNTDYKVYVVDTENNEQYNKLVTCNKLDLVITPCGKSQTVS